MSVTSVGSVYMKVSEVFKTIQGEGPWTGKPCIFVRLAGCNLTCPWCDSKYARHGLEVTVENVVKAIVGLGKNIPYVVITGGEPTIQEEELYELVKLLDDRGYYIALETNGTNNVNTSWFDLVVVSPKSNDVLDKWCAIARDDPSVVVKWVIDPDTAEEQLQYLATNNYHGVWLMPLGTSPMEVVEGIMVLTELVLEMELDAVVCNRLHIMVGCK